MEACIRHSLTRNAELRPSPKPVYILASIKTAKSLQGDTTAGETVKNADRGGMCLEMARRSRLREKYFFWVSDSLVLCQLRYFLVRLAFCWFGIILYECYELMVAVAQLVRASGCGPEGRRFKSGQSPHFCGSRLFLDESFFFVEQRRQRDIDNSDWF